MSANPDATCNPTAKGTDNDGVLVLGLVRASFTCYAHLPLCSADEQHPSSFPQVLQSLSLTYTSWSAGRAVPNLFRSAYNESDVVSEPVEEEDDDAARPKQVRARARARFRFVCVCTNCCAHLGLSSP